jgi:hypothetical protein
MFTSVHKRQFFTHRNDIATTSQSNSSNGSRNIIDRD